MRPKTPHGLNRYKLIVTYEAPELGSPHAKRSWTEEHEMPREDALRQCDRLPKVPTCVRFELLHRGKRVKEWLR